MSSRTIITCSSKATVKISKRKCHKKGVFKDTVYKIVDFLGTVENQNTVDQNVNTIENSQINPKNAVEKKKSVFMESNRKKTTSSTEDNNNNNNIDRSKSRQSIILGNEVNIERTATTTALPRCNTDSGVPTTSDPEVQPRVRPDRPTRKSTKARKSKKNNASTKHLSKELLEQANQMQITECQSDEDDEKVTSPSQEASFPEASSSKLDPTKIIFQTGWRRTTSAANLLHSGLISKGVVDALCKNNVNPDQVARQLKENLIGLPPIAGFINMKTNEIIPLTLAKDMKIINSHQLSLYLEAQVACGNIYDINKGQKLPVEAAVKHGVILSDFRKHLTTVEGAVYGFVDPRSNEMLSTFQAMERKLLEKTLCLRILAVQVCTGGMAQCEKRVTAFFGFTNNGRFKNFE